jgi:hypothetical protein
MKEKEMKRKKMGRKKKKRKKRKKRKERVCMHLFYEIDIQNNHTEHHDPHNGLTSDYPIHHV